MKNKYFDYKNIVLLCLFFILKLLLTFFVFKQRYDTQVVLHHFLNNIKRYILFYACFSGSWKFFKGSTLRNDSTILPHWQTKKYNKYVNIDVIVLLLCRHNSVSKKLGRMIEGEKSRCSQRKFKV